MLTNLLDNALRHTPVNGEVEVILAPEAGAVAVMVSDSGPGIDAQLREGLFLRAFTIGGARRDGGLGLRIVHRILQLHGRSIELVERPGHGATFRFCLETRASTR